MKIIKIVTVLLILILKMKKAVFMYIYNENNIIYKRDIFKYKDNLWKIPIKYQIISGLPDSIIKEALKEIENNTCIRFEEYDLLNNKTQGIIFEKNSVCSSQVGLAYLGGTQIVRLTKQCSKDKGSVLHEVGHALGLIHEHCRTDRDNFVTIDYNNIGRRAYVNFEIPNSSYYKNYSTNYDYGSIMHYNSYEFSYYPWRKVLSSKIHKAYDSMMGQRLYMTFNDYKKINFVYCHKRNRTKETDEEKLQKLGCRNGGYRDYKNSSRCICPFGYTGDLCREVMESDKRCNTTTFNANNTIFYHWIAAPYKCFFHILAGNEKKIELIIYMSYSPYSSICTENISHQVKYLKDKGTTGLLLCSWLYKPIKVTSEGKSVLIFYNGNENNAFIQFSFKEVS